MIEPRWDVMIPLVGYIIVIIGIGWWTGRKVESTDDYYMGGYKLPGWVLALSERSTDMSAWLLIGMPGMAWAEGLSAVWILVGTGAGMVLQWLFFSKKFMNEKRRTGAITPNDYIAKRFPGGEDGIRILGAIVVFLFYIPYVGSQFEGGGSVLNQTFGLPVFWGTIAVFAVVAYIGIAGAMFTASWTDAIQALMMVITLIVLPFILLALVWADPDIAVMAELEAQQAEHEYEVALDSWLGGKSGAAAGLLFGANLSWIWGYFGGQPHIFVRMMALRNESDRKKGMTVAFLWGLLTSIGAFLVGILARVLHGAPQELVDDAEMTLPYVVMEHTPGWLGGLLLAGALAAMMSTADSQLAVASSGWAEDLYAKVFRKDLDLDEKKKVWISRLTTGVVAVLGLVLILSIDELIYDVVGWGWSGLAGVYGPVMTLIFLGWKRYSKNAVIFTMIAGLLFWIVWLMAAEPGIGFGEWAFAGSIRVLTYPVGILAGVIGGFIWPSEDYKKGKSSGDYEGEEESLDEEPMMYEEEEEEEIFGEEEEEELFEEEEF